MNDADGLLFVMLCYLIYSQYKIRKEIAECHRVLRHLFDKAFPPRD